MLLGVGSKGGDAGALDERFDDEPLGGGEVPADEDPGGGEGVDEGSAVGGDLGSEDGRGGLSSWLAFTPGRSGLVEGS